MKVFKTATLKVRNADGKFVSFPALRGETSYDIAVANGYEGTQEEWLNMMTDENGWVTRYYELDEAKADKNNVYDREYLDKKHSEFSKLQGTVVPMYDVRPHKFVDLYERYMYADSFTTSVSSTTAVAMSPNGQYLCKYTKGESKIYLYRTVDGSRVAQSSIPSYYNTNVGRIVMDNDFIILCVPKDTSTSRDKVDSFTDPDDTAGFMFYFYKYTANSITRVVLVNDAVPYGRLSHDVRVTINNISEKENNTICFLVEKSDNYTDHDTFLYALDKNSLILTKVMTTDFTLNNYDGTKRYQTNFKCYQDGDDAILLYATYTLTGATLNHTDINVYLKRFSKNNEDGSYNETILFALEGKKSGVDFPTVGSLIYDKDTSSIIISGSHFDSSTSTNYPLTQVYSVESGDKICESSLAIADSIFEAIVDGHLIYDGTCLKLTTLETVDAITFYKFGSGTFTNESNVCSVPLTNGVYMKIDTSSIKLLFKAHKVKLGGWTVDE